MTDAIRQAALAAAQAIQSQPRAAATTPPPAVPAAPAPPPGAPTGQVQPTPPQAPPVVPYVQDTGLVRVVVDGKPMDVPVADLKAKYQIGSAAEKRLNEANQLRNGSREAIALHDRLATLARTDPRAFQEEAHKAFGIRPAQQADNSNPAPTDPNEDPQTAALRRQVAELQQTVHGLKQFEGHVLMQSEAQTVRSVMQQYPLYQRSEAARQRAELTVATALANNPGMGAAEVVAQVHALDVEFLQSETQRTYDARTGIAQQHASLPPNAGSPSLTEVAIPKMTAEQHQRPASNAARAFAAEIKRSLGM